MKLFGQSANNPARPIEKEIAAATERFNELTPQFAVIEQKLGDAAMSFEAPEDQRQGLRKALAEAYRRRADAERLAGLREGIERKKNCR